jgi:uncharacterized protein
MSTLNFLDANVWLALLWNRHIHSEKARSWFEESAAEQFFFCRFTQIAVLRLLTTEAIMGSDVTTMAGAWQLWDRIWADERVSYLAEPDELENEFRSFSQRSTRSPKVWGDAYVVAFAKASGLKLVTFDRALRTTSPEVLVL